MTAQRKPRVDPLVPTYSIDWLLAREHCATPDEVIVEQITERIAIQADERWTPAIKRQTLRYALWRHHRNYAEYAAVMRGTAS